MKKFTFLLLIGLLSVSTVYAGEVPVKIEPEKLTEVPNAVQLEENLVGGGAPSAKGLGQAAEQGIRTVIDVRDPKEGTAEEKDNADAVGLKYINIPISVSNFSEQQSDKLAEVLKDPKTGPALLHCATGQRAAAVWALYKNRHDGMSAEEAFAAAEQKGLKKPELKEKLQSLLNAKENKEK